jgi:ADP-ribosylglycohydrolase
MIGAIIGDIIGSLFESSPIKTEDFELFHKYSRFTDDTVMTIAVAESILLNGSYAESMQRWGRRYPDAGYGISFYHWLFEENAKPYNSWGNGAAMKVSPIGFAFNSIDAVKAEAERSVIASHDHPEGIRGAKAVASAVYYARIFKEKDKIKDLIELDFDYNLNRTLSEIRPNYSFDVSCQGSVPEAIIAFLESNSFEDAIRKAVSLGGDSDTQACIAGAIAEAFYGGVPEAMELEARKRLPDEMLRVIDEFYLRFALKEAAMKKSTERIKEDFG